MQSCPCWKSVTSPNPTEILSRGVSPDSRDYLGWTPLHYAIENIEREVATLLFQHAANPNIQDENGQTPLHRAAVLGMLEETRLLLAHGSDPNVTDKEGMTPLEFVRLSLRVIKPPVGSFQRDILGPEGIRRYEATEELLRQHTPK